MFKDMKLNTIKALEKHASVNLFEKNVNLVMLQLEKTLRKSAQAKGATSGDQGESGGGGADAKVLVEEKKAALLSHKKYYRPSILQRLIVVDPEKPEEAKITFKGHAASADGREALLP